MSVFVDLMFVHRASSLYKENHAVYVRSELVLVLVLMVHQGEEYVYVFCYCCVLTARATFIQHIVCVFSLGEALAFV